MRDFAWVLVRGFVTAVIQGLAHGYVFHAMVLEHGGALLPANLEEHAETAHTFVRQPHNGAGPDRSGYDCGHTKLLQEW